MRDLDRVKLLEKAEVDEKKFNFYTLMVKTVILWIM